MANAIDQARQDLENELRQLREDHERSQADRLQEQVQHERELATRLRMQDHHDRLHKLIANPPKDTARLLDWCAEHADDLRPLLRIIDMTAKETERVKLRERVVQLEATVTELRAEVDRLDLALDVAEEGAGVLHRRILELEVEVARLAEAAAGDTPNPEV